MPAKTLQLAHLPLRLVAAAIVFATLTGCQAIVSSAPEAQVRIIHATPDAPRLDLYQDSNALAFNLDFGAVTSYIPLTPGLYTIHADTAGSRQTLSTAKASFAAATQYTILLCNSITNPQQLTLIDQNRPAPPGQIALRFIHQATRAGAIDLYLLPPGQRASGVTPAFADIAFGINTGYINVPVGVYSLAALPAGTIPSQTTIPSYTGPQVSYTNGSARTIVLIDQPVPASQGLRIIAADDFDPAAQQN